MDREFMIRESRSILPYAIEIREYFHHHPELAFEEYQTAEKIAQELDAEGISYRKVGKTGIVAFIQGTGEAESGKTIALRTDMDALPIKENTELPYKSCNENMHACGHDMHMAMLLAAGKLINSRRDTLKGNVKLIFQPAEEIGKGAMEIIQSGEIQDVDTVLALHMNPQEYSGIFHTGYGVRTSKGCNIQITVIGNAESLFSGTANLIQLIAERMPLLLTSKYPYAFSPTVVKTLNENETRIFYDGRFFTSEDGRTIAEVVKSMVSALENIYQISVSIDIAYIGEALYNHADSVDRAVKVVTRLFKEESVKISDPAMFGEDFRCYASITPKLVFTMLGGADEITSTAYPLHNSRVQFSNDALFYGIAYYLGYVEDYFHDNY